MGKKLIVLIDADDTILDFGKCERNAIMKVGKYYQIENIEQFAIDYSRVNLKVWKEFEQGILTADDISHVRFERIFNEYNLPYINSYEAGRIYKHELAKQAILIDGAREFLEECYKKFRLVMVTNGILYTQERRFKKADINKYFENIFVSEKMGVRKPQKEFFTYVAFNVKDYDIDNAVLLGDSLTSDIKGGETCGIRTIWFNNKNVKNDTDIKPDYEVKSYKEAMEILDSLAK